LLQNPNDLSLSKQTFPHVVLLAPFEFGRTLFLTGVDLGGGRSKPSAWQTGTCQERARMREVQDWVLLGCAMGNLGATYAACMIPLCRTGSIVPRDVSTASFVAVRPPTR